MKTVTYIIEPEPNSTVYFLNPSDQSVYPYMYPPVVARQRLDENFTAAKYTLTRIEEFVVRDVFDAFRVLSRKIGN
jgi:hypothetical protein